MSFNFFYPTTTATTTTATGLQPPQQQPQPQQLGGGGGGRGPCSVPGCRNGHLDLLPRNKCQNCQAQLHYECTLNRDDVNGTLWCPYDCSPNNVNAQQLQLLQLQQQQQQQAQQQQLQQQQFPYPQQLHPLQGLPPAAAAAAAQQQQQLQQQLQQQYQQQHQQHHQQHATNSNNNNGVNVQQQQQLHHQLQQHQQQLQQQAQQLQQLTGVVTIAVPPPMGADPVGGLLGHHTTTNLIGDDANHGADPLETFVGRGSKRRRIDPHNDDDEEQDDGSLEDEDDEDDDDDDEDEDDLPPPPPRKKQHGTGDTEDDDDNDDDNDNDHHNNKKLSRRQQPPKTNITRTRYSNDFKMRVVSELEEPGYGTLADISKHYGVAEQTLRDWLKNKHRIQQAVQRRGNMKANPVDHLKHVTQALLKYMDEYYATGTEKAITARMIATKGEQVRQQILLQDERHPFLTDSERRMTKKFSASLSWGKKWVRQYAKPRKLTKIPADLESLSKEQLMRLLRAIAAEREQSERSNSMELAGGNSLGMMGGGGIMTEGLGGGAMGTTDPNNNNNLNMNNAANMGGNKQQSNTNHHHQQHHNLLPFIPTPPRVKLPPQYKVDQAKTRIAEKLTTLIKKKSHNWKGRPTTELIEDVPTLEAVRELFLGFPEINKTARSYRWQLTGKQLVKWLGCPKYVHPVKFEGKVVCTIGQPAYVYAFAGYDSMLAKYEQGSGTLTLKVKTYTAGTGNIPGSDEPVFLCNEEKDE